LVFIANAHADTARIRWNVNKHYYQDFWDEPLTWATAKSRCQSKGAHLATITSEAEDAFIYNELVGPNWDAWIGASDAAAEGKFKWVTGEPWKFNRLDDIGDEDYVFMDWVQGLWHTAPAREVIGYVCEWSANNYVGMTHVPDMNGNGVGEIAVL